MEGPTNTGAPLPGQTPAEAADIAENKDLAALSYVWILSLVIYFSKHNSPFVRFHAKQGLLLFAFSLLFAMIPGLSTILLLVILAFSVLGFLNAAQGLKKDLPLIGAIARADVPALAQSWKNLLHSIKGLFHKKQKDPAPSPAPSASAAPVPEPPKTVVTVMPPVVPPPPPMEEHPLPPEPPIPPADLPPSPPVS